VVKAFNTTFAGTLAEGAVSSQPLDVFLAGDDEDVEGDFDDAAAMGTSFESPAGQAALADIPNYATGGAVPLNYELRAG
jgi:hypothetical protein